MAQSILEGAGLSILYEYDFFVFGAFRSLKEKNIAGSALTESVKINADK